MFPPSEKLPLILLVAEKPSVAREHYQKMLQRVAKESFIQRDGYLEGKKYCITWCVGHLVTLATFDSYDGYDGSWKLGNLPLIPESYKLQIIERTQKQHNIVHHLMTQADTLINGADAGREGNLIFDLILDQNPKLKQKTIQRLWVNSYVDKDLDVAWNKLESAQERENLSWAARLRQRADWLIGLNATRAYTLAAGHGRLLSVGRVQTPTLNLVVQRDLDVESFQELFFYGVGGFWNGCEALWLEQDKVAWIEEKALATRTYKKCADQAATLIDWKKSTKKSFPPKPFDLTELQKEANRKFKFKAAQTLEVAQTLYEKKFISYPRTDSAYLNESMKMDSYALAQKLCPDSLKKILRPNSEKFTFINNAKVTDHYAILPTSLVPKSLSKIEGQLYQLIRHRFVQAWMEPQVWTEGTGILECAAEKFRIRLKAEKHKGWKLQTEKEEKKDDDESSNWVEQIPDFSQGQTAKLENAAVKTKKKSRPKYYTEATLLQAMKTAGKKIENEAMAEAMKDRGLGTPATQAGILETLKSRGFMEEEKGHLRSTSRGRFLIDKVESQLKSPELTGDWEHKLKLMEKGEYSPKDFYHGIREYLGDIFANLKKAHPVDFERDQIQWQEKCPHCENQMQAMNWGLQCDQGNCKTKVPFAIADRPFSATEIKQLLKKETIGPLDGFRSKRGFAFKAEAQLNKEGEVQLLFEEDPSRTFSATQLKCPSCKELLEENTKMLRCTSDRCQFNLWKTVAKYALKTKDIKQLLKKKETETIDSFLSKKGNPFTAKLKLGSDLKLEFSFDSPKTPAIAAKPSLSCPQCSHSLSADKSHYSCGIPQCGWNSSKTIAGHLLSEQELKEIIATGRSPKINGFVGKDGSAFTAHLILNTDKQIKFDLDSIQKPKDS